VVESYCIVADSPIDKVAKVAACLAGRGQGRGCLRQRDTNPVTLGKNRPARLLLSSTGVQVRRDTVSEQL
jgi:hypothetical protein